MPRVMEQPGHNVSPQLQGCKFLGRGVVAAVADDAPEAGGQGIDALDDDDATVRHRHTRVAGALGLLEVVVRHFCLPAGPQVPNVVQQQIPIRQPRICATASTSILQPRMQTERLHVMALAEAIADLTQHAIKTCSGGSSRGSSRDCTHPPRAVLLQRASRC